MIERGTVESHPYVGDSDIIVIKCSHGDYERMVKGGTEAKGWKQLRAHWEAKHAK